MALKHSVEEEFSLFEKREELRRVLESKHFANSPKKIRFLEFVAEQTFCGNRDKLNEYLIGAEVYDRGPGFDQQKDPIVRVQAHEIRRQLKRYYEEEGQNSLIRIELPTGGYVPAFSRNAPSTVAEPAIADSQPVPENASSPSHFNSYRNQIQLSVIAVLALLCAVLGYFLMVRARWGVPPASRPEATALSANLDWFWHPFLPPADPPLIVIPNHPLLRAAHNGDSPQTIASGHEIPKASLPEFRDTIHFRELKRFIFVPSLTDFTAVGETLGVVEICEMFFKVGDDCRVHPSRLVNFEEIKNGNAILLGGSQSWSGRVFIEEEGFHMQSGVILNRKPLPGERPVYRPEFDPVTNQLTRDYALVLMLPNERQEQRVLLIYGIYTQGSQAAIEFLTNSEHMAELRQALLNVSSDHKTIPPYFQALLTTTVENAVPGTTSIVAVRTVGR